MTLRISNRLKEVKEYYFSTKLREVALMVEKGYPIINMGIGNPDSKTSLPVIETLIDASRVNGSNYYQPYKGIKNLRSSFAAWYENRYQIHLDPEHEILPLKGSKEGVMLISMAFTNPGDSVLIPDPGYPTYEANSALLHLKSRKYDLLEKNGWLPDFDQLNKLCTDDTKILWVNYPHMPTGAKADRNTYLNLIDFAEDRNLLLVNDNPYSLIATEAPESILKYTHDKKHVLELNSLSKSHNMAGWRVGCLLGSAENIQHVLRIKSNLDSGMFKPVQEAAAVALRAQEEWYEELNKKYARRKEMVFKICDMLGCTYKTNSSGLFVWAKIPKAFNNDREFADYLLHEKHVFIAPGSIFGENGKNYIRISLCQPVEKIVEIINRLKIS